MQSPLHPDVTLQPHEIEPGLNAYVCPASGGVWIPLQGYLTWRESTGGTVKPLPAGYKPAPVDDTNRRALFCPESGCLLSRYQVGHSLHFRIDRSPVTGGVWLDKGEWEALKSKGLHTELPHIFTAPYQKQIRSEGFAETVQQSFRDRIGAADFDKAAEFKKWLDAHPKRRDIRAFLMDGSAEETHA